MERAIELLKANTSLQSGDDPLVSARTLRRLRRTFRREGIAGLAREYERTMAAIALRVPGIVLRLTDVELLAAAGAIDRLDVFARRALSIGTQLGGVGAARVLGRVLQSQSQSAAGATLETIPTLNPRKLPLASPNRDLPPPTGPETGPESEIVGIEPHSTDPSPDPL